MLADEWVALYTAQADRAFERHVITERQQDRWGCREQDPDGRHPSCYWFEVVVLKNGLLCYGDIDHVLWQHNNDRHGADRVHWMGQHRLLSTNSYVSEKARIGMMTLEAVQEFVPKVWAAEVEAELKRAYSAGEASRYHEHLAFLHRTMLSTDELESDIEQECFTNGCDDGPCTHFGMVPSTRLIYAHAAVRKLSNLLDQGA
jgi:hypothetical protein